MAYIVDYLKENTDINFEYVKLINKFPDRGPKYILADYRDYYAYEDNPHWCVHSATASPASLLRNLRWAAETRTADRPGQNRVMIFEAMSRTQVAAWLMEQGYKTSTQVHPQHIVPGTLKAQERIMINSTEREIQRLEQDAQRALERAAFLRSLPSEPKKLRKDDEPRVNIIFFKRSFSPGGHEYKYAAIKTVNGWYTTGPRTPKAFSWRELIAWINAEGPQEVWQAREFLPLNNSIAANSITARQIREGTL